MEIVGRDMVKDPVAAVRALIDAFNRRDRAAVIQQLHDDIVCQGMPLPAQHGLEATMALLDPFLAAEEIDWQLLNVAVSGKIVMTERVDRFRFAGQGWTEVRAAGVFEVSDTGRIIAWRDYFDMAELVAAIPAQA